MGQELIAIRSLGAEPSPRDGRFRIAFNRNQLVVFVENQLTATYAAVRADRPRHFGVLGPGAKIGGPVRHGFRASSVSACLNLLDDWPARKQLPEHLFVPLKL